MDTAPMNYLSLFTGAGGGDLAAQHLHNPQWRCLGYVEWDDYCQRVIAQRIEDGLLDRAPIFGDVREFVESGAAAEYRGVADVVTGGFPCQPFSVAGKGLGADDPRNMWPATLGVLRAVRPRFAFLENVPGLLAGPYWGTILGDLAKAGYDAEWVVLGASDVDAPHRRKRLWVVAHAAGQQDDAEHDRPRGLGMRGRQPVETGSEATRPEDGEASDDGAWGCSEVVAHANTQRLAFW